MLIMFMYCVCLVLILMDCFYCGVWVDEVLCDVCSVSIPNSVMYKCD